MFSRWMHALAFTTVSVLLGVAVLISPFGHYIEREWGLQWMFQLRGPIEPPAEVAVVGINSSTGDDMGLSRLPRYWPRSLYSVVVDRLAASEVETVVFDMDFSQPKVPVEDQTFADAVRRHGQVVLFERLEGRSERLVSGSGKERWLWVETALPPAEPLHEAARAIAPFPLPKIDKSSFQFWAFKPSADDSPTTASVAVQLALLPHHQAWRQVLERAGIATTEVPPATALETPGVLRDYMRSMRKTFLGKPFLAGSIRSLLNSSRLDPADRRAVEVLAALYGGPDERYTNLYGPPGTVPTVSFEELKPAEALGVATLPDEIGPTEASRRLADKTVFVGYSDLYSPDQPDRFYTVFTNERGIDLSGCEIMATAFANLLTDSTIKPIAVPLSVLIVAIFGLVMSQLIFWPSGYVAVPLVLAAGGGFVYGAADFFAKNDVWMPVATPIAVQLPFVIVAGLLGQYLIERRQKQRVGAMISAYLPEHLVKDLTSGQIDEASINQVVHGVCLANDMAGFTNIAEKKTPAELAKFMNAYFEMIATALSRCGVDVTEFHADTIMCAFIGEPGDPEVRRKAIAAALAVVKAIDEFSAENPDTPLTARVGLQDGPFYLGHTGGGGRLSYSILGNPANSAARLETLNKTLGTRILAAGSVTEGLSDFAVRPLGEFKVVGKDDTVSVVEVVGHAGATAPEETSLMQDFSKALEVFFSERWDQAKEAFEAVASRHPGDRPSAFYRDICLRYLTEGPPPTQPTRLEMTSK